MGLAILTKYSALAALPLMVAYPILRTKPRALMSLLIPVVVVLLWGLHGWVVYGRPHFFRTGVSRSWNEIGILIQCSGRALSGCAFVFPILLALQWNRARAIGLLVAGLLTMAFGWPFAGIWIQNILEFGMVINLAAFTFLLGRTIWGGTRQAFGDCTHSKEGRDKVFLVLWALSFPAFNLVAAEFVATQLRIQDGQDLLASALPSSRQYSGSGCLLRIWSMQESTGPRLRSYRKILMPPKDTCGSQAIGVGDTTLRHQE